MADSLIKLCFDLLRNGISYRYCRYTGKPGRPKAISLEITHKCIAKCVMCNIWKISNDIPDLSVEAWMDLLSSDILSHLIEIDITGGEPFIREDLPELISGICELKTNAMNDLKSIAITTNGFLTHRILRVAEQILPRLEKEKIELVIVCAMDAIGSIHDTIRNVKNAWNKVNETIEGLDRLRYKYSNLVLGLKTTILPINIGELDRIVRYAQSKCLFTIISPCIITQGRYLNPDRAKDLEFTKADLERMTRFYQQKSSGWGVHEDQLIRFFKTGRMKKACSCGINYFFVRSNGDLFLCPLIDNSIGNIRENSVTDMFASKAASKFRRNIGTYIECRQCTEPGLERFSLPCEGFTYLSLMMKMKKRAFLQYHHHTGLDKYFHLG